MKSIGLYDVDGHNFPNLALMKISAYHKSIGDHVEWLNNFNTYNKVYISKVFTFSNIDNHYINSDQIIKGGTGLDIETKLIPEIETQDPDYTIYLQYNYSIQIFSRGCIRNCPFCVVRQKEGYIYPVEPMRLNPNGKHIEILDNNFFANPEWKKAIDLLLEWNQPVNLHGVDIRLMNEEQAYWLNKLRHKKQIHIAWDSPKTDLTKRLIDVTKYIKPYKLMCYVLIGFDSTPEEDLYRVEKLRELKIDPFVMPFDRSNKYQKRFARWVNHKAIFKSVKWSDYLE